MNSTPAPTPDPVPDPVPAWTPVTRDGTPPVPSSVAALDWSADAATAAVGRLVGAMGDLDRSAARVVESLIRVVETGATEATLGVAVELVLSQTCRAAGFERRTLLTVATTLVRMPATRQAFAEGWISWSQVRAIVTAARQVDVDGRDRVDDLVGQLAPTSVDMEADALVFEIDWLVARLADEARTERDRRPVEDNPLTLQPALDGSGRYWGRYDADHFPAFAQSVDNRAADRFALDPDDAVDPDVGDDPDEVAITAAHRHAAGLARRDAVRRGLALFELSTGWDATTLAPLDPDDRTGSSNRPSVSVTCQLDTLLDGTVPGWLLTGLAGRIRATSATIRRWVDWTF